MKGWEFYWNPTHLNHDYIFTFANFPGPSPSAFPPSFQMFPSWKWLIASNPRQSNANQDAKIVFWMAGLMHNASELQAVFRWRNPMFSPRVSTRCSPGPPGNVVAQTSVECTKSYRKCANSNQPCHDLSVSNLWNLWFLSFFLHNPPQHPECSKALQERPGEVASLQTTAKWRIAHQLRHTYLYKTKMLSNVKDCIY